MTARPAPTETKATLWEYDMSYARASATDRKTRCGYSLRYSLKFATSLIAVGRRLYPPIAAKVANGGIFRQTVPGVRRRTALRSAGVDR